MSEVPLYESINFAIRHFLVETSQAVKKEVNFEKAEGVGGHGYPGEQNTRSLPYEDMPSRLPTRAPSEARKAEGPGIGCRRQAARVAEGRGQLGVNFWHLGTSIVHFLDFFTKHRGTALIRNRSPPLDRHRALSKVLLYM